jgi:uncharacterized integral membrane protein
VEQAFHLATPKGEMTDQTEAKKAVKKRRFSTFGSADAQRVFGEFSRIRWQVWVGTSLTVAVVLLIGHCLFAADTWSAGVKVSAAAILVAAAAGAVGVLLGFLFGIPRSLQQETVSADRPKPLADAGQSVRTNTNLEQISDWLTKIIVGVGLTQAGAIADGVYKAAKGVSALLEVPTARGSTVGDPLAALLNASSPLASEPSAAATALVLIIIVLFSIQGFLLGYLWGRIYLQQEFNELDQKAKRQSEYYEGLMNAYLYWDPPESFQRTYKLREEYMEASGGKLTPRMWTYQAFALAQEYAYEKEMNKKGENDLVDLKDRFLHALKRAIQDDREAETLLALEIVPGAKDNPDMFNGDLRAFKDDKDVRKLLGIPPEPPKS